MVRRKKFTPPGTLEPENSTEIGQGPPPAGLHIPRPRSAIAGGPLGRSAKAMISADECALLHPATYLQAGVQSASAVAVDRLGRSLQDLVAFLAELHACERWSFATIRQLTASSLVVAANGPVHCP